jgi:hypothetical protein
MFLREGYPKELRRGLVPGSLRGQPELDFGFGRLFVPAHSHAIGRAG